jgi:hypothetical protein
MKNWIFYILAGIGIVTYGAMTDANRDSSGAIIESGNVDAFQIRVGDCFDDTSDAGEEVSSIPGVPCTQPHDNEAFAVFDLSLEAHPGDEAIAEISFDACIERFEPFVGLDYESSQLDITLMYPTQMSWAQNDREVVCAVYDLDGDKLTGSVKGREI